MSLLTVVVVLMVAGVLYVRLAPTDVARWHQPIAATENADLTGGAIRVLQADAEAFARVDAYARALPRTEVIAGSVEEGRVTYRTRSHWIGFPDFTTVEYADGTLKMFARLRFGVSDLGVNAARLEGFVAAAEARGEG